MLFVQVNFFFQSNTSVAAWPSLFAKVAYGKRAFFFVYRTKALAKSFTFFELLLQAFDSTVAIFDAYLAFKLLPAMVFEMVHHAAIKYFKPSFFVTTCASVCLNVIRVVALLFAWLAY